MKRTMRSARMHTQMPVINETGIESIESEPCIELLDEEDLKLLNVNIDE